MSLRVSFFPTSFKMSFSIYGWAFFISNIVLLMILLVIDEEENQFIENGSKANKVFALPSTNTNPKFLFVARFLF